MLQRSSWQVTRRCFGWNKRPLLFNRFFSHYFQPLSYSFSSKLPGVSHIKDVLFCQLAVVLAVPWPSVDAGKRGGRLGPCQHKQAAVFSRTETLRSPGSLRFPSFISVFSGTGKAASSCPSWWRARSRKCHKNPTVRKKFRRGSQILD